MTSYSLVRLTKLGVAILAASMLSACIFLPLRLAMSHSSSKAEATPVAGAPASGASASSPDVVVPVAPPAQASPGF